MKAFFIKYYISSSLSEVPLCPRLHRTSEGKLPFSTRRWTTQRFVSLRLWRTLCSYISNDSKNFSAMRFSSFEDARNIGENDHGPVTLVLLEEEDEVMSGDWFSDESADAWCFEQEAAVASESLFLSRFYRFKGFFFSPKLHKAVFSLLISGMCPVR